MEKAGFVTAVNNRTILAVLFAMLPEEDRAIATKLLSIVVQELDISKSGEGDISSEMLKLIEEDLSDFIQRVTAMNED